MKLSKRKKQIRYARQRERDKRPCVMCGELTNGHWVPPCLGEPGFFICERKTKEDVKKAGGKMSDKLTGWLPEEKIDDEMHEAYCVLAGRRLERLPKDEVFALYQYLHANPAPTAEGFFRFVQRNRSPAQKDFKPWPPCDRETHPDYQSGGWDNMEGILVSLPAYAYGRACVNAFAGRSPDECEVVEDAVMAEVSKVYMHVSDGRFSNPRTRAEHVISCHDELVMDERDKIEAEKLEQDLKEKIKNDPNN